MDENKGLSSFDADNRRLLAVSKPSDAYLGAARGAPFAFVLSGSCLLSLC